MAYSGRNDLAGAWDASFACLIQAWRNGLLWGEMMTASATTIGLRGAGLAAGMADPRLADPVEARRMVAEKVTAAGASAAAGAASLAATQRRLATAWLDVWRVPAVPAAPWILPLALATLWLDGADKAMRPYHRRSTANARRLGRRAGNRRRS
jgi:hypothetical protein